MAKMTYSDSTLEEKLGKLEGSFRREVTQKMLWAGAKVIEKEMKSGIAAGHHIVSGDMQRSVAQTEIHEDPEKSYVEVYTQGTDRRGVSNEMKNVIINKGYYHKGSGKNHKKDPYLKQMQKKIGPRIRSVMEYQMQLTLKELGIIE